MVSGPRDARSERGAALVLALLGLLVLAVLIGTGLLLSVLERKSAGGFVQSQRAFAAAEQGLRSPLSDWSAFSPNFRASSESVQFAGSGWLSSTDFDGDIRRLGDNLFLITAEGRSANRARQRLGLVVQLRALLPDPGSALSVAGPGLISVGQNATVSGLNSAPVGWGGCDPAPTLMPGITLLEPGSPAVLALNCPDSSCVAGSPRVELGGIGLEPYLAPLEDWDQEDFASRGAVEVTTPVVSPGPVVSNATCVTAPPGNWGDPYASGAPCGRYFPLVHAAGDLEIRAGRGQGVLVVEGSLTVAGGFAFAGLVLVGGSFTTEGIGTRIEGAVVVMNAGGSGSRVDGATMIHYSSCGLQQALIGSGEPRPLQERSWIQAH